MNEPKERGGRREGAGRKAGAITLRTRNQAEQLATDGINPLEVMLEAMRETYRESGAQAAFPYAKDLLPYCCAKINPVDLSVSAKAAAIDNAMQKAGYIRHEERKKFDLSLDEGFFDTSVTYEPMSKAGD